MKSKIILKKTAFFFLLILIISSSLVSWRFLTKGFRPCKIYKEKKILFEKKEPLSSKNHYLSKTEKTQKTYKNQNKNTLFKKTENHDFQNIKNLLKEKNFNKTKILKILDKRFKYFKKGSQAFVFISEDKKYIIKFISFNKYSEPFKRNILSFFKIFNSYRKNRIFNRKRNLNHSINSYQIAFFMLKKETATKYISGIKDFEINKKIHITDNIGNSYKIDPNETFFIIQKKAKNLKTYLLKLFKKNNIKKIEKVTKDYLNLSKKILNKEIINKDSSVKNLGYVKNKLIEIDLGRFFFVENFKNQKIFNEISRRHTSLYRKFLKENYPQALKAFDYYYQKKLLQKK